jgi:hypothetical protein
MLPVREPGPPRWEASVTSLFRCVYPQQHFDFESFLIRLVFRIARDEHEERHNIKSFGIKSYFKIICDIYVDYSVNYIPYIGICVRKHMRENHKVTFTD